MTVAGSTHLSSSSSRPPFWKGGRKENAAGTAVPKEGICQLYPLMSSLLSDRQTPTPGGPHSRSKRLWSCHTLKDRTGGTSHRADGK